jgi:hypothetical protein
MATARSAYATTSTVSAATDNGGDRQPVRRHHRPAGRDHQLGGVGRVVLGAGDGRLWEVLRGVSAAVPEASTNAAILGGLGALGIWASRRRQAAAPKA